MKQSSIWKKLVIKEKRFATSKEIKELSNDLNKNYNDVIHYLQKCGYILRIFKGVFYIKTPNEIKLGRLDLSPYEVIGEGLKIKGVKNWYFGLETALKLNTMTHEYFTIDYVISDQYRTTKTIHILDKDFRFIKWRSSITTFGIVKSKDKLRYSDKEKTILDMAYRERCNGSDERARSVILEYSDIVNKMKIKKYISYFPKSFKRVLQEYI